MDHHTYKNIDDEIGNDQITWDLFIDSKRSISTQDFLSMKQKQPLLKLTGKDMNFQVILCFKNFGQLRSLS